MLVVFHQQKLPSGTERSFWPACWLASDHVNVKSIVSNWDLRKIELFGQRMSAFLWAPNFFSSLHFLCGIELIYQCGKSSASHPRQFSTVMKVYTAVVIDWSGPRTKFLALQHSTFPSYIVSYPLWLLPLTRFRSSYTSWCGPVVCSLDLWRTILVLGRWPELLV